MYSSVGIAGSILSPVSPIQKEAEEAYTMDVPFTVQRMSDWLFDATVVFPNATGSF